MMNKQPRERITNDELVIDNVLTTQPELGPTIPDGGYGWVIFFITLFFQALLPSLIVSYGIFFVFARLESGYAGSLNPKLWDHNLLYVPLFFQASWTFFDPTSRSLISRSTWPRLVATAGTCLTCAGLLFLWMGMTRYGEVSLFVFSGIVSGIGASIQIAQCEILLAQYFRLKHAILSHITQAVSALGFVVVPIVLGHHILSSSLLNVMLWYQAIILQGLILNLFLKKPMYLKSKPNTYNYYISTAPDDEEDILSKNSRELQIKRQNGDSTRIEKHEIPIRADPTNISVQSDASSSQQQHQESGAIEKNLTDAEKNESRTSRVKANWETFDDDDEDEEDTKYEKLKDWETFEDGEYGAIQDKTRTNAITNNTAHPKIHSLGWERFEDDLSSARQPKIDHNARNHRNLKLELSFGINNTETSRKSLERSNSFDGGPITNLPSTSTISGLPLPLFSDLPVNNNNTYSYDALEDQSQMRQPGVFMPTTVQRRYSFSRLELLRQPTFYKSLLTNITTKFSIFVFFTLYPSYLYQEVEFIRFRNITNLVGLLSLSNFFFSGVSYLVNIDKKRRPLCLWFLCWVGALGYFMISDYLSESVLLFGAVQITLSLSALQYVGGPLMGLTVRGEATREFGLINIMTGAAFMFFLIVNASFKDCFRLMALLNFFTGAVWLSNFIYKKLMIKRNPCLYQRTGMPAV